MRAKSMMLILIAAGCGLVASIGISQVMEKRQGEAGPVATDKIFVALTDIDIGEELTAENVGLEDWPKDKVPAGAVHSLEQIQGRFPRTRLYPGEPILEAKLMDSAGDVDSLKIPEGYRAVSIKVTMDSSVSGLIQPGDRVDVVAFLRRSADVPKTMTRTILRDVRVFAVNSETERSVDSNGKAITVKTVSLLVKDSQVEPLMLAQELGQIRLSLRRPNDPADDEGPGLADIDTLLGSAPQVADDREPGSPGSLERPGDFLEWLKSQQEQARQDRQPASPAVAQAARPAEESAFEMTVLTPEGPRVFRWTDPNQLPEEVGGADDGEWSEEETWEEEPPEENEEAWTDAGNDGEADEEAEEEAIIAPE